MPRPTRHKETGLIRVPDGEDATMTMADMQLLIESLVQRHPDLAEVAADPVLRHRYCCFVLAFCLGALRGYVATSFRPKDVHASNLVDALIACASNRLAGMMPFTPDEFKSYAAQFDWMVAQADEAAAESLFSRGISAPSPAGGASAAARAKLPQLPSGASSSPSSSPSTPTISTTLVANAPALGSTNAVDPIVGRCVSVRMLLRAAKMGRLPGILGAPPVAGAGPPVVAQLLLPHWAVTRVGQGIPRRLASGKLGFLAFEDFVWLALAEKDAMAGPSIEYWCSVLDTDDDGIVGHGDVTGAVQSLVKAAAGVVSPRALTSPTAARTGRVIDEVDEPATVTVSSDAALTQLIDALRPKSYMGRPQGQGAVTFTSRVVRERACGPVVFGLLLAVPPPEDPEAGAAPASSGKRRLKQSKKA
jgi:hypothetical protein